MRATIILGLLMVFSSSTHKVAGAPNLDTFVDDQDFGGSGDYSDHRAFDHRGEHTPSTPAPSSRSGGDVSAPSSSSSSSSDPQSPDSRRGEGGGLLDAANVATYDDEDYAEGDGDYGSGDYDAAYDGEDGGEGDTYDDEYDTSVQGGHAEDHTTTTTTTTSTTTPAPTTSTTTQPPPPPPPVVEVTTTTTTTTTPPPTTTTPTTTTTTPAPSTTITTTLLPSTTSPPSSIIEENGIYSTDEERERNKKRKKNKNNRGGAADKDKDYGYEDEEYEDEDEYYDVEDAGENYDDEDYGGEGSGAGVVGVETSEGTAVHHPVVEPDEDLHIHNHEDKGATAGEDHFTFDKAPIEEEAEEDHVPHHHTPEHKEEPAPPRTTDNEIWLTPEHPDPHVPEGEKEDDDIYDDSDPYGRRRPVDKAENDLSLGTGDDQYGRSGSDTNMDGSVQIVTHKEDERQVSIFAQPGILAAFIGGAVVGLLCAILLVMFVVYRMRKKDEGSYPLDEPKRLPLTSSYATTDKEIYA